jgi:hypothetical protein
MLRIRYFIRPFIGIGNNLFAYKWIEILVRFNRCFVVKRGAGAHAQLENARQLSAYIRQLRDEGKSIWLAQREGRAKDSNDLTQASVLHMLTLGKDDFFENVKALNICPVSISYEYDPCDYLKATEFQLKRDNPDWKKSKQDDLDNMRTGIFGRKGRVVYVAGSAIDSILDTMPEGEFTKEMYIELAARIDRVIHAGYTLFPGNYVAADMLSGTKEFAEHYTERDKKTFLEYLEGQYKKIKVENPDREFLMERMLTMYANPVRNKLRAQKA